MRVKVYGQLRDLLQASSVQVPAEAGDTVSAILERLVRRYPALRLQMFDPSGALKPYWMIFVNGHDIRDGRGVQEPVAPAGELLIFPPSAGG